MSIKTPQQIEIIKYNSKTQNVCIYVSCVKCIQLNVYMRNITGKRSYSKEELITYINGLIIKNNLKKNKTLCNYCDIPLGIYIDEETIIIPS